MRNPLPDAPASRVAGLGLAEVLVAGALLALLLTAALAIHTTAVDAQSAAEAATYRAQVIEVASELLREQLRSAGHRGLQEGGMELGGPGLALARGASTGGSDALSVRYVDDVWYLEPRVRALRMDVGRDGRGRWNLYLKEEGATRQPAVEDVSGMRVGAYLTGEGSLDPAATALPQRVSGLEVELDFTWGESRSLAIALPVARQLVEEP